MQELKLPEKLKNNLKDFVIRLEEIYQEDLVSVILYGSAASEEFIDKHSNLNLLAVLKNTDLANLRKAATLINKFRLLDPLFLTENYIASSLDTFPIEFLDMQENYFVLYGQDVLKNIDIDTKNLRFQCEQELKAKLINLRHAYLRTYTDKFALRNLLFRAFTSILHILRNILRLKGNHAPYNKREDILKEIILEFQIDAFAWKKILAAKNKQIKLNSREVEDLFIIFVRELEKLVDAVDKP